MRVSSFALARQQKGLPSPSHRTRCPFPPAAQLSASQTRHKNAKEGYDRVDNRLKDAGDAVDDCHDAPTDGGEH